MSPTNYTLFVINGTYTISVQLLIRIFGADRCIEAKLNKT